ncbi:uncharacterized [Tachysurus ichikawai]
MAAVFSSALARGPRGLLHQVCSGHWQRTGLSKERPECQSPASAAETRPEEETQTNLHLLPRFRPHTTPIPRSVEPGRLGSSSL